MYCLHKSFDIKISSLWAFFFFFFSENKISRDFLRKLKASSLQFVASKQNWAVILVGKRCSARLSGLVTEILGSEGLPN